MSPKGEEDSLKLPSEEIYAKFKEGGGCPEKVRNEKFKENVENRFKDVLQQQKIKEAKGLASEIAEGWCNAYRIRNEKIPHGYKPGYFFYYWLGDKVKDKLPEDQNFPETIKAIYSEMLKDNGKEIFRSLYNHIDKDLFERAKNLWDYKYNNKILKNNQKCQASLHNPKYTKLQGDATSAYEWFCSNCEDMLNDSYCKKFMQDHGTRAACKQKKSQVLPQLECTSASKVESEEEEEEDDGDLDELLLEDDPEEAEDLSKLPSRQIYKRLREGIYEYEQDANVEKVRNKLKSEGVNENIYGEIMSALYSIIGKKGKKQEQQEDCEFFYYWVGDKLSKTLGDEKFPTAMKGCYDEMYDSQRKYDCDFPRSPEKKKVFKASKIMFDYYKDKDSMKQHLGEGFENCTNEYYRYVERAISAYRIMRRECKRDNETIWCKEFEKMYKECRKGRKIDKECTVANEPEELCRSSSEAEASTFPAVYNESSLETSTTTTAAISSILGIGGLPLIIYFLYKYTSIFSGIGGTLSGRRSRKRSTIKHELNTSFSGHEDTSTDNSSTAEYATTIVGSLSNLTRAASSTIADSTYESTAFGGPTSTRGRANNRRQPQRQQNLRNISYGRM